MKQISDQMSPKAEGWLLQILPMLQETFNHSNCSSYHGINL